MNESAKTGIGGFLGNGNLDVSILGERIYKTLACSWGSIAGFFLLLFPILVLLFVTGFNVGRMMLSRRTRKEI